VADTDSTGEEAVQSPIDALVAAIDTMFPDRTRRLGVRRINVGTSNRALGLEELEPATTALADAGSHRFVDADTVIELLGRIERLENGDTNLDHLRRRVIEHVEGRWQYFGPAFAEPAVERYQGHYLLRDFPRLGRDPAFLIRLAAAIRQRKSQNRWLIELLAEWSPIDLDEARPLVAAAATSDDPSLSTALFVSIGRGVGWTPWVSLMAILKARPDYAEPGPIVEPDGDPMKEPRPAIAARLEMASALERKLQARTVAGLLLDVLAPNSGWATDGLLARPAETRSAYVDSLKDRIGDDADLRRAGIEALLWWPTGNATDLAQFAAVALAEADDRPFLEKLSEHSERLVQYAARAVRAAKFADPLAVEAMPTSGTLVQSIAALGAGYQAADDFPRTWLGDRAVERLIEHTIARVEAGVAGEFNSHGDEGEDRLLSSLFRELALRFRDLDTALEALGRAVNAPHRASVTMAYRNVDRPEEGTKGIKGAKSFSADLCLIVDPVLDGISLGRRITLIQAKRLYRNKKAKVQPTWNRSFAIDHDQRLALQRQTHSSAYLFFAPPLGGRGVPVIPTQLVADLSAHKSSGTSLRKEVVAIASRSLADWLTYDALALRVGDLHADLVAKADGDPGGLPRPLLDLPTVEVEISRVARSERRR
jgi:hypothetical protein